MSNKKNVSARMQNTLNELDTAINQWDSLTNKPQRGQAAQETDLQKRAKTLLKELRDQIQEFDQDKDEK
jgi:ElaB/YqjD/DUF883 family membrane-anchored ribosome-binding protein